MVDFIWCSGLRKGYFHFSEAIRASMAINCFWRVNGAPLGDWDGTLQIIDWD